MTGWGWAMMIFWSVTWILLLGVIIWAAASWARTTSGGESQPSSQQRQLTARELLDQRLAAGDLSIEDYEARKAALGDRSGGSR